MRTAALAAAAGAAAALWPAVAPAGAPPAVAKRTALPGAYRVTVATHTSSSEKSGDGYAGRSSASWKLARPRRGAPNRLYVNRFGTQVSAMAMIAVTGAYRLTAQRDGQPPCEVTARSGAPGALMAPRTVALSIAPDPRRAGRLLTTVTGVRATLGGPDVPSECATDTRGEPGDGIVAARAIPASTLRRRAFTLRYAGVRVQDGITYRWHTTFRLVRAG